MRLICPNCGAQYEVPTDVLPTDGRDVQCSNCGQTWFQDHPDNVSADETETAADPQEDEEVVTVDDDPPARAEQQTEDQPVSAEATETDVDAEEPQATALGSSEENAPTPVRRELDPSVANVLRAEAEMEEKARRLETGGVESQPDLGLVESPDDADRRGREAQDRMARMRGETTASDDQYEDTGDIAAAMASRRDLLPDIEEINSTLRSNNDRSPDSDPGQTAQIEVQEKRSSRRGFIVTVVLVAILALVYSYASRIAEAVPQLEPALSSYVSIVDGWRSWLDGKVSSLLSWLDAAAQSSSQ